MKKFLIILACLCLPATAWATCADEPVTPLTKKQQRQRAVQVEWCGVLCDGSFDAALWETIQVRYGTCAVTVHFTKPEADKVVIHTDHIGYIFMENYIGTLVMDERAFYTLVYDLSPRREYAMRFLVHRIADWAAYVGVNPSLPGHDESE